MQLPTDDCAKRRLIERAELTIAAEFLLGRGLPPHDVGVQLSRFYYIDIDTLNEVVESLASQSTDRPLRSAA